MTVDFRGLAVPEAENAQIRFTGYDTERGEPVLIVCHISYKTLLALCTEADAIAGGLMRVFDRHRDVIHAAAAAKCAHGESAPVVTLRDILLRR